MAITEGARNPISQRARQHLEVCQSSALCDPELGCRPLACVEGETRCFGYQFQRCAADQADWEPVAACVNAAACDPELGCVSPAP